MFISRLKDLREDSDLTQQQIAELLNCTQQSYCNYEKGNRELPNEMLLKLAKIYNTSTDYILGLTDEK